MSDERILKQAQTVYETICKSLDARGWNYDRHDDRFTITCAARGEDIPMELIIITDPGPQLVSIYSPMPFKVSEDKRAEFAQTVCVANYGMMNGGFDYNIATGEVIFRIVSSYRGSILSEELFDYMVYVAFKTIDDYNDKFLMVEKGMFTAAQLLEWKKNHFSGK